MPKIVETKTQTVGKWHMGYCDERYSPTFRGFDSFMGYLNGAEDYFQVCVKSEVQSFRACY